MITYTIPPFLPIMMSVCTFLSLSRLTLKGILCSDASKTFISGKISNVCFDKTGTLTTLDIEVLGFQSTKEN